MFESIVDYFTVLLAAEVFIYAVLTFYVYKYKKDNKKRMSFLYLVWGHNLAIIFTVVALFVSAILEHFM